ncbi:MAG: hypothetical protein AAFV53_13040 [Myxococcota bacterium]
MILGVLVALSTSAHAAEEISAEAVLQSSPQDGLVSGFGARLDSGGAFLSLDGRGAAEGNWIGRATAGFDLFGDSDTIDLTLGLFLGTTGDWGAPSVQMAGTAGFEVGVGANIGPLRARYRHADGFRGPLESRLTEDEFRVGYRIFGTVEPFGQYIRFNPGDEEVVSGYGAGVKIAF